MTLPHLVRLSLVGQLDSKQAVAAPARRDHRRISQRERASIAVEALLTESRGAIYRYCMRLTGNAEQALDLTQETMLRAWRNRDSLENSQAARTWLFKIATNCWTDQLRTKPRQPHALAEPPVCKATSVAQQSENREALEQALAALDQLPDRQRQVMYLITIEQLSTAEVAEVLGISPTAVKASLSAARKQLRQQLKSLYDQYCPSRT